MRDGNKMVPILDVMKESTTMPAELVDEWRDSRMNSQLSKVTRMLYLLPSSLPLIPQILYKEGMKCTQERAKNRPKMKEVVSHLLAWILKSFPPPGVRGIAEMRESLSNSVRAATTI